MAQAKAIINIEVNTSTAAAQLRNLQNQVNSFATTLNKNNLLQAEAAQRFSNTILDAVSSTRFFTAESVRMETAARRLDQTLSKGRGTLGQYFSARFRKDSAEAASVLSLANSRAQALQTTFIETSAASKGFRDTIAIRPLAAFNTEAEVANQKLAIHRAMLRQATTSMINFGKNTQWAGRQLMVGFTVPLAIFGSSAAKTFKEIEQAAVRFKKVYGDAFTTPGEIEKNMKAVEGLALEFTKYGIAVSDTIALAAEAAAAGAQNAELIAATTEATRLATLGQMEQGEALAATIALQNAFRLSSKELATEVNFLNMVENQTVVTLQDLAEAIPRVAPVIVGLGGDVRDMAAMLAAMQEGGVSAAQGANALKSGLGSLINPTNNAINKLQELGINLNAIVQANRGDLMGTVQAFGQALATLDQFSRQQALEEVFGKYQYARLGALFDNIIKDGTQASRVLQIAGMSAEQMAKSAERELSVISEATSTKYMAAMERFKMAIAPIGELFMKISTPILNFFSRLFEMFDRLPDGVKNFAAIATVIVGVVVPAGTMFLGLFMNLIGTLLKFGNVVGSVVKGFGKGGLSGAIQAVSQSLNYMSLEEMDAANAATQFGTATGNANKALLAQITSADNATVAFSELATAINLAARAQQRYAETYPLAFAPGATAAKTAAQGPDVQQPFRPVRRNAGGTIPGFGDKDTVPAMLTPGEFVVNKKATEQNLPLLYAINNGGMMPGFNSGGGIAKNGRMFYGRYSKTAARRMSLDIEDMPPGPMRDRLQEALLAQGTRSNTPTQTSAASHGFMTISQLTGAQRSLLNNALKSATPRLEGVEPVQLLSNLIGAGPSYINQRARLSTASSEDMALLTSLVDFYRPAFTKVPAARGALANLGLEPLDAANLLSANLSERFRKMRSSRLSDTDIYDEVAQAFENTGLTPLYTALTSDRNAIRYTLPTDLVNELRRLMPTGSVHDTLLERAFPGSVSTFRDSRDRPGYVVAGSALGLPKDLLLMPGLTYSTGTGMSYEDIAVDEVGRAIQGSFGGRGLSPSELKIIRMHLGKNKGGMIPGVQYFAQRFPGRLVKSFLDFIKGVPGPRKAATAAPDPKSIVSGLTKEGLTRRSVQTRLDRQYYVPTIGHGQRARSLSALVPKSTKTRNEQEVENAIQTALSAGWISEEDVQHLRGIETFNSMKRTDLAHREAADIFNNTKIFTASGVLPRPGLENLGIQYLFGSGRSREIFERLVNDKSNARFKKRYASEIKRIIDDKGHPHYKRDYEFLDELFKRLYKSKDEKIIEWINQPQLTQSRWLPLVRGLVYNKKRDKKFKRSETLYEEVSKIMNANSGGMIPGVQYLMAGSRVGRISSASSEATKEATRKFLHERFMARDAKDQGLTDFIFRRGEDGKLNLSSNELIALLTENPNVTDKELAQIAKYHGSRIRDGVFGKFNPEVGFKTQDRNASTWRHIATILGERGHSVIQKRNDGGLISGIQYLFGGGPAIGATVRRLLASRQRKILAAEPDQTLESAAQQYADHGYASLTPAQRVLLSQSREPFAGPQLFRGAGGSSPLIDSKLRDALARGSYRDIIDLEGEMIPFPKGSWSTDERIAYDHMRYFASENQEWSNAIDMLTVRGSVPLYGSTYKEHIKGEQANVIRKIKDLKVQLKQAQDRMSPEAVAQEEARIEQLRLAVEQERKSARSKFGFTEDQDLTLTQRAMISDSVRESKAQRDYDIAKKSHRTNLEYPAELQRRIDEQIKGLYYKRNKRKQAFAEIERLRQQGSNVNVFFKATKSDRYVPPGEARINYIQDLTEGDPNDPLTTKLYVIGLDMGYPEMVDISGKPFARHGGRTNEYEFIRQNKGGLIPIQHFNTGGMADPIKAFATGNVFESGGRTIVPGVGNTDTVPAALTPGEFVINKKATRENLPLLNAINSGAVPGFNSGGMIGQLLYLQEGSQNPISPFSPQALYPSNPSNNPTIKSNSPVDVNVKEVSGQDASRSNLGLRRSGVGLAGNAIGMSMMMAPMMIPQIGENPAASMGFQAAGMGLQFLDPLMMMMGRGGGGAAGGAGLARLGIPLLSNPYTAAIAAAAAAISSGLILWRKNIDDTSRETADMGANLGVTSNALTNMAKMIGTDTPIQRQAKFNFAVSQEESQLAEEISPYFQSEQGQKFIDDLKEATGEERVKKLSDYVKSAVASKMLDKTEAVAFAKAVSDALGDQNLGIQIAKQIRSQEVGSTALLDLAKTRSAAIDKNALVKQAMGATGDVRSITAAAAAASSGAAIQAITDYSNAAAMAKEELLNGTITFQKYHEIVKQTSEAQGKYQELLRKSFTGSMEQGGTLQAIIAQLEAQGYSQEQLNAFMSSGNAGVSSLPNPINFLTSFGTLSAIEGMQRGSTAFTRQYAAREMEAAGQPVIERNFAQQLAADTIKGLYQATGTQNVEEGTGFAGSILSFAAGGVSDLDLETQKMFAKFEEDAKRSQDKFIKAHADGLQVQLLQAVASGDMALEAATAFHEALAQGGTEAEAALDTLAETSDVTMAALRYTVESGGIAGLNTGGQRASFMQAARNFQQAGFNEIDLQNVISSVSTSNVGQFAIDLKGMDAKEISVIVEETTKLNQLIGPEGSTQVMDVLLNEEPQDFEKRLPQITKYITDLQEKVPNDVLKQLRIDVTNVEDMDKYGPLAKDLENLSNILASFPAEIREVGIEFMLDENGNPVTPDQFGKSMRIINKAYKDLGSLDEVVEKKAILKLLRLFEDENGKKLTEEQAAQAYQSLIKKYGKKKIYNLPEDIAFKVLRIQVRIEGLQAAIKKYQAAIDAIRAGGDSAGPYLDKLRETVSKLQDLKNEQDALMNQDYGKLPGAGAGGGGGGGGQKSILQELKDQLNLLKDFYKGMKNYLSDQTGLFKNLMAGPFAPQFIEYLKSQGDRGIKLLKDGGEKLKKAYEVFVQIQRQVFKNTMQNFPSAINATRQKIVGENAMRNALEEQGLSQSAIDMYMEQEGVSTTAQEYQRVVEKRRRVGKKKLTKEERRILRERNRLFNVDDDPRSGKRITKIQNQMDRLSRDQRNIVTENMQDANRLNTVLLDTLTARGISPEVIDILKDMGYTSQEVEQNMGDVVSRAKELDAIMRTTKLNDAMKGLQVETQNAEQALKIYLSSFKNGVATISPELASQMAAAGIKVDNTQAIQAFKEVYDQLERLKLALKSPLQLEADLYQIQQDIARTKSDIAIEEQLTDDKEKLKNLQKENDLISRRIELRQRDLEPIDEEISKLDERKTKVQEFYDAQLEALDEVYKKEEDLNEIRQGQLDIASALSRGDIAGAAQSALQLQQQMAQTRQDNARSAIEKARNEEIKSIDNEINGLKEKRKKIEEDIKELQKEQRVIQDDIYNTTKFIADETERIEKEYGISESRIIALRAQLEEQLATELKILGAIQDQNKARSGAVVTSPTTPTTPGSTTPSPSPTTPAPAPSDEERRRNEANATIGTVPVSNDPNPNIRNAINRINLSKHFANYGLWPESRNYLTAAKPYIENLPRTSGGYATLNSQYSIQDAVIRNAGYNLGGSVKYKGSREPAPGMMFGGRMKKFAIGSIVPGRGMTDKVPAMLTPGEFVIRKPVAEAIMPQLTALNGQIYPKMLSGINANTFPNVGSYGGTSIPKNGTTSSNNTNIPNQIQYNYSISVNAETNASAQDIADQVIYQIKRIDDRKIKGITL